MNKILTLLTPNFSLIPRLSMETALSTQALVELRILHVSDTYNHDILLSKLKCYGISGKDLILYQSYLDNRYCRTAIYNDSSNSDKVSSWAILTHGVPQGSVLGPLLLFLYINDLPKIINKTSAPIIFADGTGILFAHSNLIDFNKNVHIVFAT